MTDVIKRPSATLWSIQYLRAAAAIGVVLFHQLQGRDVVFRLGEHGVDMFFVISGFIMVALTDGRAVTPQSFMLDRVARITPPYWIATFGAFLITRLGLPFYHGTAALLLLVKAMLFIPAFNPTGQIEPTMFLGWTLNFEMFFYVIFAFMLLLPRARLTGISLLLGGLVLLGAFTHPTSALGLTYTNPLLLEFVAGAFLGRLFGIGLDHSGVQRQMLEALAIAVALAIVGIWSHRIWFGAISVCAVAAGLILERLGHMPKIPWLRLLGDASFAIYLLQQFAFEAVGTALPAASKAAGHPLPHALVQSANILAAVGLGVLFFLFVERPLTRAIRAVMRRAAGTPIRLRPTA